VGGATAACALGCGAACVVAGTSRPPTASNQWTLIDATPDTRLVPRRRGAGAVDERADDHTKHLERSRTWLPPRVGRATASSPRPGSTMRPCHGRVAWASSPVAGRRRRPARHVAEATAPGPAHAAAGPRPRRRRPPHRAGPGDAGPVEVLAPRPTRPCCPTCHRSALGAGRVEERDHAHGPDGPDKAVPPTVDVAGPGGWVCRRLGWAVRRPVLVLARAAGSVAVAEMRVRRASWPACGRRGWAGWRDR
jgi:hypothetical protein